MNGHRIFCSKRFCFAQRICSETFRSMILSFHSFKIGLLKHFMILTSLISYYLKITVRIHRDN